MHNMHNNILQKSMMTAISSFLSNIQKQRTALQSFVATIPFLIYFRDEFYNITYVRGSSMAPTISKGDIVLVRKRDAGSFLLNILHSIGFIKHPSDMPFASENSGNRVTIDNDEKSQTTSTSQKSIYDDDRIQALRYQLGNTDTVNDTNFWLISPSHLSPLILPGHVVVYQNPSRFPEVTVKRAIGVGGQRIATGTKVRTNAVSLRLPNDILMENTQHVEERNMSEVTTTNDNDDDTESLPSLLQHLRRRQQQKRESDEYYDLRLPPHFIYTENDNHTTDDSSIGGGKNPPVSQNLMLGIAEYIIWPPSRFQRIERQPAYETIKDHKNIHSLSRPRAIWD